MVQTLLVEGTDDQHVVWNLLKHHKFPEVFKVEESKGVDALLNSFPVHIKGSEVKSIGIILDADLDLKGRWNAVRSRIVKLGYNPPAEMPTDGLVLTPEEMPRFGAWMMPDNSLPGMLEDFVGYLVPPGDALWSHADSVIGKMPEGLAGFSINHKCKAHIHTWLAWQKDPGTPMGLAITKNYLDAESPQTGPFLDWLKRLFVD
jgi:hypothetical protein